MHTTLSSRLRADTSSVHRLAERSGIMRDILGGRLERASYVELLVGLHGVYDALEQALAEQRHSELLVPFHFRTIARADALANDIAFLHGPEWRSELTPSDPAIVYAGRARVAEPMQLVAHAYVRYMGDMSGGQALKRVIGRALGLEAGGLAFYDFPDVADLDEYKQQFRVLLDAMPLSEDEVDRVVAEAVDIFGLNINLFEAVTVRSA